MAPRRRRARRPPARAPDPVGFDTLSDDLVMRAMLRAPFVTHGSLRAVNHRFQAVLGSDAFRKLRLDSGLAEHGVVVVSGWTSDGLRISTDCKMLLNGRWRPIPPI